MNAVLTSAESTRPAAPAASATEVHLEALSVGRLDAMLAIENSAYEFPWTRGNFIDSLASGYAIQLLCAGEQILGYFVAMRGVDEVHLLNLTVAPPFHRQGWSVVLLEALAVWARGLGAQWLWLEVRAGNLRAQAVYQRFGFRPVGQRPRYYPTAGDAREDAVVMSVSL